MIADKRGRYAMDSAVVRLAHYDIYHDSIDLLVFSFYEINFYLYP